MTLIKSIKIVPQYFHYWCAVHALDSTCDTRVHISITILSRATLLSHPTSSLFTPHSFLHLETGTRTPHPTTYVEYCCLNLKPCFLPNFQVLDFDFEKFCSVSLSNLNVYGCLVCGKYFGGRAESSHAFTHSLEQDHHVFINLHTEKVYCLPDGYEVSDPSLEDIRSVLNPR